MRILIAQLNPTIGNLIPNTEKILRAIAHGKKDKADLVVFSELVLSGYPPDDLLLLPAFIQAIDQQLKRIIEATKDIAVILGLPRHNPSSEEKPIFNSAAIISNQQLLGYYDKMLLPTYDVFDERRYFEPGLGPKTWLIAGKKVLVTICEDIWQHSNSLKYTSYLRDPILESKDLKPDLLVNLSASPFSANKPTIRQEVCNKVVKNLHCPMILCNQVGGNDSLIFDGYSLYLDAEGAPKHICKGFEEDLALVDLAQNTTSFVQIERNTTEDLYRALVLGVKDYFHKEGFLKACLGLSGGVDSSVVACIAKDALGKENVLGVTMPSRFSSEGSVTDSVKLADKLGIKYEQIPIESAYKTYIEVLTPFFENKPFDVTEENIQARIRGMILMALSNKLGYIVLSTGNKSEMAMGYCTLYGDMCGGLGVINDLTKKQVYELAKWINRNEEIIPIDVLTKPPSAELRPNQKDSDSLPEFDIVDTVLQDYIEDYLSPEEISAKRGYPLDVVRDLIQRIHRNEYKRRQSAPGLRVSEKAFSIGRRFPIVQKWV